MDRTNSTVRKLDKFKSGLASRIDLFESDITKEINRFKNEIVKKQNQALKWILGVGIFTLIAIVCAAKFIVTHIP